MTEAAKTQAVHGGLDVAAVYRAHFDFVWRSAARLGVPSSEMDDAVQDVFVVVSRRLEEFEGRANIRTWLFAIITRVAMKRRRAGARHRRRVDAAAQIQSPTSEPHTHSDAVQTLQRMLGQLDENQRMAYILVELEGLSAVEVARDKDIPVNTVYGWMRKARARMQALASEEVRS